MRTFHGFVDERSALKGVLKDTAGLADYSVTEGQPLDVPLAILNCAAGQARSLRRKSDRTQLRNRLVGEIPHNAQNAAQRVLSVTAC